MIVDTDVHVDMGRWVVGSGWSWSIIGCRGGLLLLWSVGVDTHGFFSLLYFLCSVGRISKFFVEKEERKKEILVFFWSSKSRPLES